MSRTKAELEAENRELKEHYERMLDIAECLEDKLDKVLNMNITMKRANRKMLLDLFRHEDVRESFFADRELYAQYLTEDLLDNKPNPTDPYSLDEWNKMWE